jgi:hypothetical protein
MTAALPVRVMVQDAWDQVLLQLPASTPVSELKRQALQRTHVDRDPTGYLVKFRGAELLDENRTLDDAGVVGNAQLIVLARRRRPVR